MNNSSFGQKKQFFKHYNNNNNRGGLKRLGKKVGNKKGKRNNFNNRSFQEDSSRIFEADTGAQNNIVFIGDLPTSQLTNNDIDTLLNSFVNQNEKKKAHAGGNETTGELLPVDKVRVFKDSIYVSFVDEKDAQDAVAFFNGFRFKGFALRSFYTDSSRLRHKTPQAETSFIPETTPTNSKIARFQFTKTECEIIVVNRCLKKYADSINDRLYKDLFGMNTFIKYLNTSVVNDPTSSMNIAGSSNSDEIDFKLIEEAIERDLLYLIWINQSSEHFNSINLFIFNKWRVNSELSKSSMSSEAATTCTVKEYKNMPLNKALELLRPDYYNYLSFLKLKNYQLNHADDESGENEEHYADYEDNFSDDQDEQDGKEVAEDETRGKIGGACESDKFLLHGQGKQLIDVVFEKFAESSHLTVKDMDFLLTYLKKQKESLVGPLPSSSLASDHKQPTPLYTQPGSSQSRESTLQQPVRNNNGPPVTSNIAPAAMPSPKQPPAFNQPAHFSKNNNNNNNGSFNNYQNRNFNNNNNGNFNNNNGNQPVSLMSIMTSSRTPGNVNSSGDGGGNGPLITGNQYYNRERNNFNRFQQQ